MDELKRPRAADDPPAHVADVPNNVGTCEVEFDSGDCFGIGYVDPSLNPKDARRAIGNRHIHLDHLIGFLAEDEGLDRVLPGLWDFFECHKMPGCS
jgi:hypothetical protein